MFRFCGHDCRADYGRCEDEGEIKEEVRTPERKRPDSIRVLKIADTACLLVGRIEGEEGRIYNEG